MESVHYTRPNRSHNGSSEADIQSESNWSKTHNHRIGFRDRNGRPPGYTHIGDEWNTEDEREFLAQAREKATELNLELKGHDLINIRELMAKQEVCSTFIILSTEYCCCRL